MCMITNTKLGVTRSTLGVQCNYDITATLIRLALTLAMGRLLQKSLNII